MTVGAAFLAFGIAAVVTLVELLTSNYPRTAVFLQKSWSLYSIAAIYGLIAFGALVGLDELTSSDTLKLEGLGLSSVWVQAIVVGLSTKALLHVRLFNVTVGAQAFPIGIESLVQLFEPWLLRTITVDEWNSVMHYLAPRAKKYPDLPSVKQAMKDNLPSRFPDAERTAFALDLDRATAVEQAMDLYIRFVGRTAFERVFP